MPKTPQKDPKNNLNIECDSEEEAKKHYAKTMLDPNFMTTSMLKETYYGKDADALSLMKAVREDTKKVKAGDTTLIERMLVGQAHVLNATFAYGLDKARSAEYLNHHQIYAQLALKAQNQCRQTLTALAELKNPKNTTFIKNQAHNQQVNINSEKNRANELLSEDVNAPLDTSGKSQASNANQTMETVGA